MKTTFRILAACLAASLALVSCDKESLTKSDNGASKDGARVVTVSFSHTTKSGLGADGLTPHFTSGDVIKVFNGQDKEDCTVSVGADGTATISIQTAALKTGTLTAVYPADAYSEIEPYYTVGTSQDGTFAKANICTATITDGSNPKAEFVNQTAILKFYVDESIGVSKIEIEGEGVATGESTIIVTPSSGTSLYNVGGGPDPRICYAAVLPVSETNITLKGTATTQNQERPISNATLAANTIYNAFIPYYIDLGDAGKWGYCNVGAFLPEEYGLYFAWGETDGHKLIDDWKSKWDADDEIYLNVFENDYSFSWTSAPFNGGKSYFDIESFNGFKDAVCPNGVLASPYDAATVNWGTGWRMPTKAEFDALMGLNNSWNANYNGTGLKGREFGNENTVFFPAAGYGSSICILQVPYVGDYWSSLVYDYPEYAYILSFGSSSVAMYYYELNGGHSVRPLSE